MGILLQACEDQGTPHEMFHFQAPVRRAVEDWFDSRVVKKTQAGGFLNGRKRAFSSRIRAEAKPFAAGDDKPGNRQSGLSLSLIHISEPTRRRLESRFAC